MRPISWKAIVAGGFLDILLTGLFSFSIGVYAATKIRAWTLLGAQRDQATVVFALHILVGSLSSVAAGYVAARIARHHAVLHGALSAWLCVACGVYALIAGHESTPQWSHLLFPPISPALGAIGGYLWNIRNQGSGSPTPAPAA